MTPDNELSKTRCLVLSALLVAVGLAVPAVFHTFGDAGRVFLPMYLPLILGAFILPPRYAAAAAVITPLLSHTLTSMPAVPILYFMTAELVFTVLLIGFLNGKIPTAVNIVLSFFTGRAVHMAAALLAAGIFSLKTPYVKWGALVMLIPMSLPGLALQLTLVPLVYHKVYLKRFCNGKRN